MKRLTKALGVVGIAVAATGCSPGNFQVTFYDSLYAGKDAGRVDAYPVADDGRGSHFQAYIKCWHWQSWNLLWVTVSRYGNAVDINAVDSNHLLPNGGGWSYARCDPSDDQALASNAVGYVRF